MPRMRVNARAERGGMVAGSGALELLELALLLVAVGRWQDFSPACRSRCGCATHQDFPRHYHTDLDQFVSRP
jgi:hypothetical protein